MIREKSLLKTTMKIIQIFQYSNFMATKQLKPQYNVNIKVDVINGVTTDW